MIPSSVTPTIAQLSHLIKDLCADGLTDPPYVTGAEAIYTKRTQYMFSIKELNIKFNVIVIIKNELKFSF